MEKIFTANKAYKDCIRFFEEVIEPTIENNPLATVKNPKNGFESQMIPKGDFKIELTVTHKTLVLLTKRYPDAEYEFKKERVLLPGATEADRRENPLWAMYTKLTIDFSPYGTLFGSINDGNGGGKNPATTKSPQTTISPTKENQQQGTPMTAGV